MKAKKLARKKLARMRQSMLEMDRNLSSSESRVKHLEEFLQQMVSRTEVFLLLHQDPDANEGRNYSFAKDHLEFTMECIKQEINQ